MKTYDLRIHEPEPGNGARRVEVLGCLDSHTVVGFEKSLSELLESSQAGYLLVDLSQLNYISSAGISALMGLTHRLRKRGGEVVLLRPTEKVYRVFRTLGFTNIFTICDNEAEARKALSS
ncbi:MAG: STAS domain-containing protein [Candidatus Sumerlaeia bacterium]|nr:STAS domain-containing protein [Candidatus Sumerlaeia bacterium]